MSLGTTLQTVGNGKDVDKKCDACPTKWTFLGKWSYFRATETSAFRIEKEKENRK
jgi:hypothetical protein